MDLEEFKAFAQANELTVRPYKRLIWALLGVLLLFILLFGGAFYYFMYMAFSMDASAFVAQDMVNSNGSTNNVEQR